MLQGSLLVLVRLGWLGLVALVKEAAEEVLVADTDLAFQIREILDPLGGCLLGHPVPVNLVHLVVRQHDHVF